MIFTVSDYDLNNIKNNDLYRVFKSNLEVLEALLSSENKNKSNEEVREIKIRTMRYAKGYPLDFNKMIAIESDNTPYLLEFYRYKLVKCQSVSEDYIE